MPTQDKKGSENGKGPSDRDLDVVRREWSTLPADEPARLLDQAVLNRARRAVEQRKSHGKWPWLAAIASAAVVVLALTLILEIRDSARDGRPEGAPVPAREEPAVEAEREPAKSRGVLPSEGVFERSREEAGKSAATSRAPGLRSESLREAPEEIPGDSATPDRAEEPRAARESAAAEEWVRRLIRLKRAQDLESLEAELAAFRKAYPDYPLPAELGE